MFGSKTLHAPFSEFADVLPKELTAPICRGETAIRSIESTEKSKLVNVLRCAANFCSALTGGVDRSKLGSLADGLDRMAREAKAWCAVLEESRVTLCFSAPEMEGVKDASPVVVLGQGDTRRELLPDVAQAGKFLDTHA